jgi:hypothetical protein
MNLGEATDSEFEIGFRVRCGLFRGFICSASASTKKDRCGIAVAVGPRAGV